jgi:hypothetical protein
MIRRGTHRRRDRFGVGGVRRHEPGIDREPGIGPERLLRLPA